MRPVGGAGCSECVQSHLSLRAATTRGLVAVASAERRAATSRKDAEEFVTLALSRRSFCASEGNTDAKRDNARRVLRNCMRIKIRPHSMHDNGTGSSRKMKRNCLLHET